jgi:hypothetical protein
MSPAMCCSRTKTCPRRAATIPGAGEVRGKRSQLAARFSSGTTRPNTRIAAPHPQNDRGQPAGRPLTISVLEVSELATDIRRLAKALRCRRGAGLVYLCACTSEDEKSHGIITLHSGGEAARKGRASEEMDVAKASTKATTTRLNMQDSGLIACPGAQKALDNLAKLSCKNRIK